LQSVALFSSICRNVRHGRVTVNVPPSMPIHSGNCCEQFPEFGEEFGEVPAGIIFFRLPLSQSAQALLETWSWTEVAERYREHLP
jgi:hypothetical protein